MHAHSARAGNCLTPLSARSGPRSSAGASGWRRDQPAGGHAQRGRIRDRFPFHALRQKRRRRLRNRTPDALKAGVGNRTVLDLQIELEMIAAEGKIASDRRHAADGAKIPRARVVFQNFALVEISPVRLDAMKAGREPIDILARVVERE